MQTIGERLEEARKRKGISIREASEATKIRSDYLQKFESNTFELNLPDIYVRGFLRTYAHYLKINSEKLLTDFAALGLGSTRDSRRQDHREIIGRLDLPEPAKPAPAEAPAPAPREAGPTLARVTAPSRPTPVTPQASDNGQYLKYAAIVGGALLAVVVLFFIVRLAFGSGTSTPSATTAPTAATPTAPAAEVMRLHAVGGNVHVSVKQESDGQTIFDGDLVRGDTRTLTKQGKVWVTYDVGSNLQVEIRGQRYKISVPGRARSSFD